MKNLLLPKRIIFESNVINSNNLFIEKEKQIHLNEKSSTLLKQGSSIILDFGKEIPGSLRILTVDATNNCTKIHIRFGESVGECSASIGYKNATNDHSTRDIVYDIPFLSDITIASTGFRFVRIDKEDEGEISFKNIYAVIDEVKPIDGYFRSDDELLNQIFDIAAYTNAVCHRNGYYYDGIKRDRLVWIGDSYPIYRAGKYIFLEDREITNSLEFATIEMPLPGWVNWSPMYSFWWTLIFAEYYIDHKDEQFKNQYFDYMLGIIHQSDNLIKENGDLLFPFLFIDWPSHYDENEKIGNDLVKKEDEIVGCRFLISITLKKVLEAFNELLKKEDKDLILDILSRLKNGKTDVIKYKQIAALGVFNDIIDDNKKDVLLANGANGLSTFLSYFIFSAIDKLGHHEDSINYLKQYYGKMIELGATSFFEDFDINWANDVTKIDEMPIEGKKDFHGDHGAFCYRGYRHSLCHGWSSGVIAYIYEYILGVNKIGFNQYEINPNLGNINDVEFAFATNKGLVKVIIKDKKITNIEIPDGIKVITK